MLTELELLRAYYQTISENCQDWYGDPDAEKDSVYHLLGATDLMNSIMRKLSEKDETEVDQNGR